MERNYDVAMVQYQTVAERDGNAILQLWLDADRKIAALETTHENQGAPSPQSEQDRLWQTIVAAASG